MSKRLNDIMITIYYCSLSSASSSHHHILLTHIPAVPHHSVTLVVLFLLARGSSETLGKVIVGIFGGFVWRIWLSGSNIIE